MDRRTLATTLEAAWQTGHDRPLLLLSHPWAQFLARRALRLAVVLGALVVVTFLMVRLVPGDPVQNVTGLGADAAVKAQVRHELGLDEPAIHQFFSYVGGLFRGDLGRSFAPGREPVSQIIQERAGPSIELAGASLILVLLCGFPLGMLLGAATREGRRPRLELIVTGVASVVGSLPEYLAATFLAFVFAVWLRLLPVAGSDDALGLVLPVLAISLRPIAVLIRIVRVETLNVLAQDYIRTARSKRLPDLTIFVRHVLPNVVTSGLTVASVLFAGLIGGAILVENVFGRVGLGTALVNAVLQSDYQVVQGVVLMLGVSVVLINTIVDILLGVVDPRSLAARS